MEKTKRPRSPFASRLCMLRGASGMTQKQVSQHLNIDRSTYAYYETDKTKPDFETLLRIASMYDVTTDYLLGAEEAKSAPTVLHAPPIPYNDKLRGAISLSNLPEDEKSLLVMYRQLPEDRRKELLDTIAGWIQHTET